MYRKYVVQLSVVFKRSHADNNLKKPNEFDPAIKFLIVYKDHRIWQNSMETNITVTTTKKCKFKIHGKQGIANVHIERKLGKRD